MAVVRVQGTTATNSGTTNVVSATLTGVAAGNLLIVGAFLFGSTTATATCSDGTSYTATTNSPATNTAGGSRLYLFYLPNAGAGSHTVTVTWSTTATAGNLGLWFTEFSGILTASPLDVDSVFSTPSAGTNINTPSITPTASGELLYFMAAPNATMTSVNSPWTVGTISSGDGDGYILSGTTSPTAVNATQNSSATWVAMSAAFKLAAASGGGQATTTTPYLGIWSKDSVLACGAFDVGIPIRYGLYDDDFVAQFSGTTVGATVTGVTSVPVGLFSKDATLVGAFDA